MIQAVPRWHTARTEARWTDGPGVAGTLTSIGRPPTPWQRNLLDVAGERLDGPGSPLAYDTVIVIVGRRCGKTTTEMGVPLHRALDGPIDLPNGRTVPFRAAHTAQGLTRARDRFLEDLAHPYIATLPEADRRLRANVLVNIATTQLTVDPFDWRSGSASSIQVYAPTASAMRSAGIAFIGIDEALVFPAEKGRMLLAAARPTMAEFHGRAQMWVMSNVGLSMQSWLPDLRDTGRAAVDSGEAEGVCYVEFSIPDDADPADEEAWHRYYPALGDGLVGLRELRADLRSLGLETFAAEYLNRWPSTDGGGDPPLGPEDWLRWVRPGAEIVPGSDMWGGADMAPDGSDLFLVACGRDAGGRWLAQVARFEPRAGNDRVSELLVEWARARPNLRGIGFDPRTLAGAAFAAGNGGAPMMPVDGAAWGQALRGLLDRARAGLGHPHGVGDPAGDALLRHLAAARTREVDGLESLSRGKSHGPVSGVAALMMAVHMSGLDAAPAPFAIW